MKTIWNGLLLALQFFTVLPIKRELPMTRQTQTAMYSVMPVIGILFGGVLIAVFEGLQLTTLSPLFIAIALVVVHIICTGGLHLDGYVDVSDAFFSYGDRQKRLEILEDPRTGAFGVISVVVLLLLQVAALHELVFQQALSWLYLLVVPVILRTGVMLYFSTMKCAKEKGIAYYFATNMNVKVVQITALLVLVTIGVIGLLLQQYALVGLVVMQMVLVYIHKKFSYKHFGGMNGDLSGALYEGSQTILWLTLLLFM